MTGYAAEKQQNDNIPIYSSADHKIDILTNFRKHKNITVFLSYHDIEWGDSWNTFQLDARARNWQPIPLPLGEKQPWYWLIFPGIWFWNYILGKFLI